MSSEADIAETPVISVHGGCRLATVFCGYDATGIPWRSLTPDPTLLRLIALFQGTLDLTLTSSSDTRDSNFEFQISAHKKNSKKLPKKT